MLYILLSFVLTGNCSKQNSFDNPIYNSVLLASKNKKKDFLRIYNMHCKKLLAVEEKNYNLCRTF